MNELKFNVVQSIGEITANFDEFKNQVSQELEKYKSKEFTEDTKKDAKKDLAELRKKKAAVNERRIEVKKEYMNYYTTGEQRTGCMFCGFGAHLEEEPNRFQRMSVTHPKCYEICMNLENNGVKYKDALETCGISTETWEQMGQMDIFDFIGGMQ